MIVKKSVLLLERRNNDYFSLILALSLKKSTKTKTPCNEVKSEVKREGLISCDAITN
jgi:hypothetical protein